MQPDFLIVGSGLTGAVIGRTLQDAGYKVLIVEKRSHVGGNVHDHVHPSGIRVHTYGPHYFRTSSEKIWNFVNRFASFYPYQACLKSFVDGRFENWPIAQSYILRTVGENWKPDFSGTATNFEEACLAMMPRPIYEKFIKIYNEKQWGVPPNSLNSDLAGRFDVRMDDEPRLKMHKYQGIPEPGYAHFMTEMLKGIPLLLNVDYLRYRNEFSAKNLTIFTGPIDLFFDSQFGKLQYRGQSRETEYLPETDYYQPCGQVNYPTEEGGPQIRTLEWKHMLPKEYASRIKGTVITKEITITPQNPDNYEYPFPDGKNRELYEKYRMLADSTPGLLVCGRLGEYRYYDMDQAIARAMVLAQRILKMGELEKTLSAHGITTQILNGISETVDQKIEA